MLRDVVIGPFLSITFDVQHVLESKGLDSNSRISLVDSCTLFRTFLRVESEQNTYNISTGDVMEVAFSHTLSMAPDKDKSLGDEYDIVTLAHVICKTMKEDKLILSLSSGSDFIELSTREQVPLQEGANVYILFRFLEIFDT
tara:strand:- start:2519 stop:2944 length:426 start_codon:yes stop_codon:yes gene_type:complete